MRVLVLVIFATTYVAISARRLRLLPIGRPAAALVGAATCMALGAIDPEGLGVEDALRSVEPHTITLLFGMMVVAAGLDAAGFFAFGARALALRALPARTLLILVTVSSGLLSAVLVNDAVCLLGTPMLVGVVLRSGLPLRPFLFAIAMGSNAGSALTLSGNPQNMLVAQLSDLTYRGYLASAAAPTAWALLVTAMTIAWVHRTDLAVKSAPSPGPPVEVDRPLLFAAVGSLAALVVANVLGAPLALTALLAASAVLIAARRRAEDLLLRVDFGVLIFFAGLFVLVAALGKTGYPAAWLAALGDAAKSSKLALVGVLLGGSQLVSNVPLILLLEPWIRAQLDPSLAWTLTALASTLAGNLTLLGSVANVIVIERALLTLQREGLDTSPARIGFFDYLKIGVPVTILSMVGAVAIAVLIQ
ncbi:MAG: arsenic transporter [Deltaproteobacteria bacterium]|nr:arsenic transporter [Deltaproteobacteria bacterium]